jgi:hypothetical protein
MTKVFKKVKHIFPLAAKSEILNNDNISNVSMIEPYGLS